MESEVTPALVETDAETAFNAELLHMFQQRLQLLAGLALLILPFFALYHAFFSPATRVPVALTHCAMVLLCVVMRTLATRVTGVHAAQRLAYAGYAVFSILVALVATQLIHPDTPIVNQFIAYSSFSQILLSMLLLPFSALECAVVALLVIVAMLGASYWMMPTGYDMFYLSHLFVLGTTALVVGSIAHFQSRQLRGAFNAAFALAHSAAQLEKLSTEDALTGGFNRHYLERAMESEIARASRFDHELSIIMFDLDNFKIVNDTHGHAAGDEVLCEVYAAVAGAVREVDTVARYGGDEFVCILPETGRNEARFIAERMQKAVLLRLRTAHDASDAASRVTISMGMVTMAPGEIISVRSLIERADERLYEAKRGGKNRLAG
jgi:diguanylate cyclase (GGDEF)-like protein